MFWSSWVSSAEAGAFSGSVQAGLLGFRGLLGLFAAAGVLGLERLHRRGSKYPTDILKQTAMPCYTFYNAMPCSPGAQIDQEFSLKPLQPHHCRCPFLLHIYVCNACMKHHNYCESCPVSLFNNCKVTMIVMNSSSQLSEMLTISYMLRNQFCVWIFGHF